MRARQRFDSTLDRGDIALDVIGPCQPHDRLHHRKRIAGAVIDFARQQILAFFGFFALGDIDGDAAHAHQPVGGIEARGRSPGAPAHAAARLHDAEIGLHRAFTARHAPTALEEPSPIFGVDHGADIVDGDLEASALDAENMVLAFVPLAFAVDGIEVPRAHLAGGERQAAALLALHEPHIRRFDLGRTLADAPLQLGIEPLELPGLAIKLGEDPDLGAQHRRHDRDRHVIDGTHLVAAHAIDIVHLHGGDEDDRGALKARMLADHGCELKAVELRHAHVDQHDRGFVLEQEFQRLARRARLDEILAETAQNLLVGEQLGGLIVDQENVDLVVYSPNVLHGKA